MIFAICPILSKMRVNCRKCDISVKFVKKSALVRRQRQGCWDVYCIAAVGQMMTHRDMGYEHGSSTC